MRSARIRGDGTATYHCMSRVIQRQMVLGPVEKEKFRGLMRQMEDFCGVRILTYAIMTNHFHLLVQVPRRRDVSDRELVRRVKRAYGTDKGRELELELAELIAAGETEQAETVRGRYTYRMYDVSEFMKTLKQRFTQWFNRKNGRKGTLWEERFKSLLVEGRGNAVRAVAAYIDLNAVRAGVVADPKDYRYCGYGEAVGGEKVARGGLGKVLADVAPGGEWRRVSRVYRQTLFERGVETEGRAGISKEKVRQAVEGDGELSLGDMLRCRVRYFSDGVVLGSRGFVEEVFAAHREQFGVKRKTGARAMRFGDWGGLCTMRDLRETVIAAPG